MSAGVKVCSICGESKCEAAKPKKQWMAKAHACNYAACVGEGRNVRGERRECTDHAEVWQNECHPQALLLCVCVRERVSRLSVFLCYFTLCVGDAQVRCAAPARTYFFAINTP